MESQDETSTWTKKWSDFDLRLTKIEIYFKVALAVAAIFGIGAGIGTTILQGANHRIADLTEQVDKAEKRLDKLTPTLEEKQGEFEKIKNAQLIDFKAKAEQIANEIPNSQIQQKLGGFSASLNKLNAKDWKIECKENEATNPNEMAYAFSEVKIPADLRKEYVLTGGGCSVLHSDEPVDRKTPGFSHNPPITVSKPTQEKKDGPYVGWFCKGGDLPNLGMNILFRITSRVIYCRVAPRQTP